MPVEFLKETEAS